MAYKLPKNGGMGSFKKWGALGLGAGAAYLGGRYIYRKGKKKQKKLVQKALYKRDIGKYVL